MRTILTIAFAILTSVTLAMPPAVTEEGALTQRPTVVRKGVAVGALEDVAATYFSEVGYWLREAGSANVQISAKEMLTERDGLTDAQADEVIAIAAAANKPVTPPAIANLSAERLELQRKNCAALTSAKTRQETVAILEARDKQREAENRAEGVRLLSLLKPDTKVAVNAALAKYREGLTTNTMDWSKATDKHLAAIKTKTCAATH